MNTVIMIGRLARVPEIRLTNDGKTVARFNLAVDRRFTKEDIADFFDVVAFGKLGEFCEKYLGKGTKIGLTGRIENNNYTNRDGQKVYGIQIIADSIEFAGSKPETQSSVDFAPTQTQEPAVTSEAYEQSSFSFAEPAEPEDLPFS